MHTCFWRDHGCWQDTVRLLVCLARDEEKLVALGKKNKMMEVWECVFAYNVYMYKQCRCEYVHIEQQRVNVWGAHRRLTAWGTNIHVCMHARMHVCLSVCMCKACQTLFICTKHGIVVRIPCISKSFQNGMSSGMSETALWICALTNAQRYKYVHLLMHRVTIMCTY